MKPWSQACERNRDAILERLRALFAQPATVLEIGAGTGQHAVYFASAMPDLTWIATDLARNLPGIRRWIEEAGLANVRGPLELDVRAPAWPIGHIDHAFSANTTHIMPWNAVVAMYTGVGRLLPPHGRFVLYGPCNRRGHFTSHSNQRFDAALRAQDPAMGLRDDAALEELAQEQGLALAADESMPANNRLLVWERR